VGYINPAHRLLYAISAALPDSTRRAILERPELGDTAVIEVAAPLDKRDGKALLTHTHTIRSPAARESFYKTPMQHGVALGYDRLEKLLVSKIAGRRRK
jgi:hypothetical protein